MQRCCSPGVLIDYNVRKKGVVLDVDGGICINDVDTHLEARC